jgi:hypothetical protein
MMRDSVEMDPDEGLTKPPKITAEPIIHVASPPFFGAVEAIRRGTTWALARGTPRASAGRARRVAARRDMVRAEWVCECADGVAATLWCQVGG